MDVASTARGDPTRAVTPRRTEAALDRLIRNGPARKLSAEVEAHLVRLTRTEMAFCYLSQA
jgi:hypothetical protein